MANLDKLLKRIEKNSLGENEQQAHSLHIIGEDFEVLTMTRKERTDFFYKRSAMKTNYTIGEFVTFMKPYIYKALQLADLAEKAISNGYIKKYHDVIDYLFNPEEIMDIIDFIIEINNIGKEEDIIKEDVDNIKKQ